MTKFLFFIDELSTWVGKAFAWLILVLTLGVSYEVFVRYVLRAPTTWAFDISYITYGAMFLMAGAYTLSRNGHVRADVVYRLWSPRTQATMDLVLKVSQAIRSLRAQFLKGALEKHAPVLYVVARNAATAAVVASQNETICALAKSSKSPPPEAVRLVALGCEPPRGAWGRHGRSSRSYPEHGSGRRCHRAADDAANMALTANEIFTHLHANHVLHASERPQRTPESKRGARELSKTVRIIR